MNLILMQSFKNNIKMYNYLKEHSYYYKLLDRSSIDFKTFQSDMKVKYKERPSDKIANAIDKINLVNSVLDVLN